MNGIIDAISSRRAKRALSEAAVPAEVLDRVLEAATLAPSCMNKQPWRFLALNEPAALERARSALSNGNDWARRAPVLIAAIVDLDDDCRLSNRRDYALFDLGLAVGNLMTQATAEGLISHPMAGFDPTALKAAFDIGDTPIVAVMIAVGRPGDADSLSDKHRAAETAPRDRRVIDEVVFHNAWPMS